MKYKIDIWRNDKHFKVIRIEDLIGLKVQAIANDEARKPVDLADIRALIALMQNRN